MKELSIKEKAKRYDEAIKRIENIKTGKCETTFVFTKGVFEYIFPELKESEDERTRNEIIAFVEQAIHRGGGTPIPQEQEDRWIVWLEKQGQQSKEPTNTHEVVTGNGNIKVLVTEKVQLPKFKVGDKIRRKTLSSCDKDMQVARIEKDYYICNHIGKFSSEIVPFSKESSYELIEQKPAWSEEMGKLCLDAISLLRDYASGIDKNGQLGKKISRAEAFLSDLYHNAFYPSTYNMREDLRKSEWSKEDKARIKQLLGWIDTLKNYIHYDAVVPADLRIERIDKVVKLESWLKSIEP